MCLDAPSIALACVCVCVSSVFVCALLRRAATRHFQARVCTALRRDSVQNPTLSCCVHRRGLLLEPTHLHTRPCVGHAASTSIARKQALHNTTACCTQQCTPWAFCIGSRLLRAPCHAARHDLFPALLLEVHQRVAGVLLAAPVAAHPAPSWLLWQCAQCSRPVCGMPFCYGSSHMCCDFRVLCLGGRPCLLSRATQQSIAYCACCTQHAGCWEIDSAASRTPTTALLVLGF